MRYEMQWIPVTVKAVSVEDRTITGTASTHSVDYGGDVILPSAWKDSLRTWKKLGSRPKFLAYHQHALQDGHSPVIGKLIELTITDTGLDFKAWFAPTALGEEHLMLYSTESMDAFSVGFMAQSAERDKDAIGKLLAKAGISTEAGDVGRVITKAHLLEISCVVVGMNMGALASKAIESPLAVKAIDRLEKIAGITLDAKYRATGPDAPSVDAPEAIAAAPDAGAEEISNLGPSETEPEYLDKDPLDVKAAPGVEEKGWEETENEIRHRVREPNEFEEGTFRTIEVKKDKPRVRAIVGKLKGEKTMTIQAYRFPIEDGWTMAKAKAWVKENASKSFALAEEPNPDQVVLDLVRLCLGIDAQTRRLGEELQDLKKILVKMTETKSAPVPPVSRPQAKATKAEDQGAEALRFILRDLNTAVSKIVDKDEAPASK